MNQIKHLILTTLLTFGFVALSMAQPATIRGKVTNGTTGETLIGATILLQDPSFAMKGGAYSDLEGSYTIKAPAGTYKLIISFIGFLADTLDITATSGEVIFNETLLLEENAQTDEVIITAKRSQASDIAFQRQKQNSVNSIDGVTFDLVQRTGDGNVAAAMQRVVGVTVEGGKYVYVRGLGDRYSKTLLNGAELPSLDPNRNTVQMDIFPSNLIDNVTVYKNFTPDLPGSFTGGLIDIRTKDFPDRFTLNVSASLGYNTIASLNDNFLSQPGGATDWLGIDDGTRALPTLIEDINYLPTATSTMDEGIANRIDQGTKAFTLPMNTEFDRSFLNQNYQLSLGNQYQIGTKNTLGFIASLSYRNEYEAYNEGGNGFYVASGPNDVQLSSEIDLTDSVASGTQSVLWGGLAKLSYKIGNNNKISFNYMHNTSAEQKSYYLRGFVASNQPPTFETRGVNYLERNLDIFQLNGEHVIGEKFTIDWIASQAQFTQDQPDQRFLANKFGTRTVGTEQETFFAFDPSEFQGTLRFFREMDEVSNDAKLNFTYKLNVKEEEGKIKFGGAFTTKERNYRHRLFEYQDLQAFDDDWDGDPATLFVDANLGVTGTDTIVDFNPQTGEFTQVEIIDYGIYIAENINERRNSIYNGTQNVAAGYAMVDYPFSSQLRFIGGVRYERTDLDLLATEAQNQAVNRLFNDFLPSVNFIYSPGDKESLDKTNLRLGYSRTLARPSYRELAQVRYLDYIGGFEETGNPNLTRTLIDNFDLRWEWFFNVGELVSASLFYKNFQNPIERVVVTTLQNPAFTYVNQDQATVYGLEFELKKSLGFIPALKDFSIGGNFSLIQSSVTLDSAVFADKTQIFPGLPETRPLYSQSPYAVNAELLYNNQEAGFTASLSYNVFGPRLIAVGTLSSLDAYEQPRGLLNFSVQKKFAGVWGVRFRANNLLNPEYFSITTLTPDLMNRSDFDEQDFPFQSFGRRGRTFSLSVSYNIK